MNITKKLAAACATDRLKDLRDALRLLAARAGKGHAADHYIGEADALDAIIRRQRHRFSDTANPVTIAHHERMADGFARAIHAEHVFARAAIDGLLDEVPMDDWLADPLESGVGGLGS